MITLHDVQGHWVRDWIKTPGIEDHTTRVHWMQAGWEYADVRVPLERPDLGSACCLAELNPPTLLALTQAEGFAGHVTLDKDTCTWHRQVNWHGVPDASDVGKISFDAQGRMIEAGVLAEYTELWEQHATAETEALRFADDIYSGLLVMSGDAAVVGIGRATKPVSKPVLEALKAGSVTENAHIFFDGLHALCQISGTVLTATLATNPFVEGTHILTVCNDNVTWHQTGFSGERSERTLQIETVLA